MSSSKTKGTPEKPSEPRGGAHPDMSTMEGMAGYMIRIVQIQMFQAFFDQFKPKGLSAGVFSALVAIRDNPGIKQGVLGTAMLIKRANMTKLISGLQKRGLVERRVPENDRRAIELHLTRKGSDMLGDVFLEAYEHDHATLNCLSAEEKKQFFAMLGRISADLREQSNWAS